MTDAAPSAGATKVDRLRRGADFERMLRIRPCASQGHFDLRHLGDAPLPLRAPAPDELSTGAPSLPAQTVDGRWLGMIVPKRHARRSVSRQLIRRQIREALRRHAPRLPGGVWVVRLRSGFDRRDFPSAASDALRAAVRAELDALFARPRVRAPARDGRG